MKAITIPLSHYLSRRLWKKWNLNFLTKSLHLFEARWEKLGCQIIGLDKIKRKLLLIRKGKDKVYCSVVDLQDLQQVSLKKTYKSIDAGDLSANGLNYYLQSISLQFGFKSGAKPIVVNFYESDYHSSKQQSLLEKAAKKWEQMVIELLPPKPLLLTA